MKASLLALAKSIYYSFILQPRRMTYNPFNRQTVSSIRM